MRSEWLRVLALSSCAWACPGVGTADTFVVPDRYVVQRGARSVAALGKDQVSYIVEKPHEHFDVVVPARYVSKVSAQSAPAAELLHPAKVAADCAEIRKDPTVESCEPDVIWYPSAVPNDTSFSRQWHLHDPSGDGDIEALTAWDKGMGRKDVLIGVLDTGVYWSHPDLVNNMWSNPNEPVDGIDNDGNGYIDDVVGVNSANGRGDPTDPHGHGTHVAGIIGAQGNNGRGVSGVMWRVSLVGVSATTSSAGTFTTSALVAGLDYFRKIKEAGHNLRAVNASWGGNSYSDDIYQAINRLNSVGVLVVCAAGNDGTSNDTVPHYPSDYDLPNVVSVAATGPTIALAAYSNFGNSVDIAAPGGDSDFGDGGLIYSTFRSSTAGQAVYSGKQGTSMAAPVVTGAIGLLSSQRPLYTSAELRSLLLSSADVVPGLLSYINSGRFLNVATMSTAADPYDECPSDSAKVAPGVCGCGVVESLADADIDGTLDCLESCPADSNKTDPGSCGCGVSDADTNGNGTPDCLDPPASAPSDNCPSDTLKVEPGVCGCGVADDDLNSNGTVDCLDPKVSGITPTAPTVQGAKGKVVVTLTAMSGVTYALKITTQAPTVKGKPKPKAKVVYVTTSTPGYTVTKLKAKTKASISYAYVLQGTPLKVSQYSRPKTATVK